MKIISNQTIIMTLTVDPHIGSFFRIKLRLFQVFIKIIIPDFFFFFVTKLNTRILNFRGSLNSGSHAQYSLRNTQYTPIIIIKFYFKTTQKL